MPKRTTLQCPHCGRFFPLTVETVIDAQRDPEAKMRLLSGRLNEQTCPSCQMTVVAAAPLLYHDGAKELLIAFVPMELNLSKEQQERAIGELMRELTSALPREAIKGYIFQPRQALTMQGMIDQILQADGVTPEMLDEQRARAQLIESLLSTPESDLPAAIAAVDDRIDLRFVQLMNLMAQRLSQEGERAAVERINQLQQTILAHSTFGKTLQRRVERQEAIIAAVSADLNALPEDADRPELLDLALRYGELDEREDYLQAFAALARPALDDEFFNQLTLRIGQAPASARSSMERVGDLLRQYTAWLDQRAQAVAQNAAGFLQALVNHPDPDALLRANADMIDDALMAVLNANLQQARRRGDQRMEARLREMYDRIMAFLDANMQPELRFINQLLAAPSDEEARTLLKSDGGQFASAALLEMMDAVGRILESRGETALLERLALLRQDAAALGGD
jgi:hypothetical protein